MIDVLAPKQPQKRRIEGQEIEAHLDYSWIVNSNDRERLSTIEKLLETKKKKGARLCWIRWNPNSKFGYDIDDAREDIHWMVYEIERLREENAELKSFAEKFRKTLEDDIQHP